MNEADILTVSQIRRAVETLRSHRAGNQESDLTPEQRNKLRESFDLLMGGEFKDSPIKNDINELKNVIMARRLW